MKNDQRSTPRIRVPRSPTYPMTEAAGVRRIRHPATIHVNG
jgi:hypothetical protein